MSNANNGMQNPYFAGRIIINISNGFNYKQIIANIIHNARVYKSDYIMFTTDDSSARMIINKLSNIGIRMEHCSVGGETLIVIAFNDSLINQAKNNGIKIF